MKTPKKKRSLSAQRKQWRAAKEKRELDEAIARFKLARPDLLAKPSR